MRKPALLAALSLAAVLAVSLAGCSKPDAAADRQFGYDPKLPEPVQFLLPPMGFSQPIGWQAGELPSVPAGFTVNAVARDLNAPRNVLPLPGGDIVVAEAGDPGFQPTLRPKDVIFALLKGATHSAVKPGNRVLLLHDIGPDGVARQKIVLIDHLTSPFGLVWLKGELFVAATDRLLAYRFAPGQTTLGPARLVTELPGGPIDHHYTKSLTASPDGTKLYVGVGSNSNIVENGMEAERDRARILEVDPASGATRVFATGLRNPNGLTFAPGTRTLYAVVNERDELGNNLVPDYLTSVKDGGFYGWPWSYYGKHIDIRVHPQRPDMVARAIIPDYSLSSHVAALGLAFTPGGAFPAQYQGGAFVGEHGSWDRTAWSGYQVAFVPFAGGRPSGDAQTFVGNFITAGGKTHGRPVGIGFTADGALLIADDVGNVVWRVTASKVPPAKR